MALTISDTIRIQEEYYRTNAAEFDPTIRAAVAIYVLRGAWTRLARRRSRGDNDARKVLQWAAGEVGAAALGDLESQLAPFRDHAERRVSSRPMRMPFASL